MPDDTETTGRAVAPPRTNGGLLTPWKPGQSGNPQGLTPALKEVYRLARAAAPDAMKVLIAIAADKTEEARCRIVAANSVLDRAVGKSRDVPTEADSGPLDLSSLTDQQIKDLDAALKVVEALTGRGIAPAPAVRIVLPDNGRGGTGQ